MAEWGNALLKFCSIALVSAAVSNTVLGAQDPLAMPAEEAPASSWSWFGDLMLGEDHVTGIPRADSSLQRTFGRARAGVLYDPVPTLEFGGAIKLAASSDENSQDRRNNFNERSNDVALDQLFVR